MNTLFALVVVMQMVGGGTQEAVLDVYPSLAECHEAALDQHVLGDCWPVDQVIPGDEHPAMTVAREGEE